MIFFFKKKAVLFFLKKKNQTSKEMYCVVCRAPEPSFKCAKCKLLCYCSRVCQRKHWQAHKPVCNVIAIDDAKLVDMEDLMTKQISKLNLLDHSCDCKDCSMLCQSVPGIYDPQHVLQLLQENETFFDTVVQDYFAGNQGEHIFFLRPAQQCETPGTRTSWFKQPQNPCRNLGPNGCMLSRETRPMGCRVASGCDRSQLNFDTQIACQMWNSPLGKKVIEKFNEYQNKVHHRDVGDTEQFRSEETVWMNLMTLALKNNVLKK